MKVRLGSFVSLALAASWLLASRTASAVEIDWKGLTWSVTNGGMAGVAAGSPANVSVDQNGYLHLQIRKNGDTWTAAELFTTTRLGFGTYQWQVDGPIDTLDKNVVLGLFPYGPAAGVGADGTNEIDIEYSRWGQENGPNGDWTNYPASGTTIGEHTYKFSLSGGTLSTSRFIWTSTSIEDFLLVGLEPPSSNNSLLETWKYSPSNAKTNIPQQPLPLGMNLWCYALPSDGKEVEIVVRDFQFVPEGTSSGGAGGGGSGGTNGSSVTAGASAVGGSPAVGGATAAGGATAVAGTAATSGGTAATTGGASSESGGAIGGSPSDGGSNTGSGGAHSSAGHTQSGVAAGPTSTSSGESTGCNCRVAGVALRAPPASGIQRGLLALLLLCTARRSRRTSRR